VTSILRLRTREAPKTIATTRRSTIRRITVDHRPSFDDHKITLNLPNNTVRCAPITPRPKTLEILFVRLTILRL
jgi:hypothetical protein